MAERADVLRILREARGAPRTSSQICEALNLPVSDTGAGWQNFAGVVRILAQLAQQHTVTVEYPDATRREMTYALPVTKEPAHV